MSRPSVPGTHFVGLTPDVTAWSSGLLTLRLEEMVNGESPDMLTDSHAAHT